MEQPDVILTYLNTGGVIAALVLAVYLGMTGQVIPRKLLDAVVVKIVTELLDQLKERGMLHDHTDQ